MTRSFCKQIVGNSWKKFNEEGKALEYEKREITKKTVEKSCTKVRIQNFIFEVGEQFQKIKGKKLRKKL